MHTKFPFIRSSNFQATPKNLSSSRNLCYSENYRQNDFKLDFWDKNCILNYCMESRLDVIIENFNVIAYFNMKTTS